MDRRWDVNEELVHGCCVGGGHGGERIGDDDTFLNCKTDKNIKSCSRGMIPLPLVPDDPRAASVTHGGQYALHNRSSTSSIAACSTSTASYQMNNTNLRATVAAAAVVGHLMTMKTGSWISTWENLAPSDYGCRRHSHIFRYASPAARDSPYRLSLRCTAGPSVHMSLSPSRWPATPNPESMLSRAYRRSREAKSRNSFLFTRCIS